MKTRIFLDSGAFSHYQVHVKARKDPGKAGASPRARRRDSYDYLRDPSYSEFRSAYAAFVKEHEPLLEAYPNLDVIGSGEATWSNQVLLEDLGLRPLPVWHLGTDESWLRLYLDQGYPYVCLGGMVGVAPATLRTALDSVWRRVLTDDAGMPRARVHGFGMTSFELMRRYPWYSVDSKAWISCAQFGSFYYARPLMGRRDWLTPKVIKVTEQSYRPDTKNHYRNLARSEQADVRAYLQDFQLGIGKSRVYDVPEGHALAEGEKWVAKGKRVEVIDELGVSNHNLFRVDCNLQFLRKTEAAQQRWPWALSAAVKHGKVGLFS